MKIWSRNINEKKKEKQKTNSKRITLLTVFLMRSFEFKNLYRETYGESFIKGNTKTVNVFKLDWNCTSPSAECLR